MHAVWTVAVAAVLAATTPAAAHSPASRIPGATHFGVETRVTPQLGSASRAQVAVDTFGNVYVVAGKGEDPAPVAASMGSTVPVRALPWLRVSGDTGLTWRDLSIVVGGADAALPAGAAAVAADDAGRVYVLDTTPGAVVSTFRASQRNVVAWETTRPVPGATGAGPRPLVAAHGDGRVVVLDDRGTALAGGRYAAYVSTDHGQTFTPIGAALEASEECSVAADRRTGSKSVYAACTGTDGTLHGYASADDGVTWLRSDIAAFNVGWVGRSAPAVAAGSDGVVWVLYVDTDDKVPGAVPKSTRLKLYRSADRGRTWKMQDITPKKGVYVQAALGASFHGRLGISVLRPEADPQPKWYLEAAIFRPGTKPWLINFASHTPVTEAHDISPAPGPLSLTFGRDNLMSVLWLHDEERIEELGRTPVRELWFCQTLKSTKI